MSSTFYPLKVDQIIKDADDAVIVYFEIPAAHTSEFEFLAGQYISLKIFHKEKEYRRAYSICSSPKSNKLGIAVKLVEKGLVSTYIHSQLKEGDIVECMKPEGKFIVEAESTKVRDHYFIAAGSGITPIISMVETLLEDEPQSRVYLIFGNRNEDGIMFKDKIDDMAHHYKGQFFVQHILSKPKQSKPAGIGGFFKKPSISWKGLVGRIRAKVFDEFLEEHPASSSDSQFYLCGPGEMIEKMKAHLMSTDISSERIHTEYFTNPDSPNPIIEHSSELRQIKVHLEDQVVEIEMTPEKTILEALIDNNYDPPYSCTSGACSTCVAKIIEGEAKMDVCYALEDDEVEDGYILTCQARPISSSLEIKYEE
jgi:ring-1,2-phenylacetyl-CoA epoxidase subunit PaaE